MNIGQNKSLVFGGGLLLLLMLAGGYFLWTFHGKHKTATSDLEAKVTTLAALKGSAKNNIPAPTAANADKLDKQIQLASAYYTNYVSILFQKLPPQKEGDPSDFQLEIETTVNEARAYAESKEVELGDAVPLANPLGGVFPGAVIPGSTPGAAPVETEEVFFMDFDKYTKEGERPERSNIPRLSRQLAILDDLVRLLVDQGVDRIVGVKRDPFDLEAEESNPAGLLIPFNPGGPTPLEEEEEEVLYENEVLQLQFEADEASVMAALSAINRLPYPATISQVHLKNMHNELIPFQEASRTASGVGGVPGLTGGAVGGLPAGSSKKSMTDLILSAGREPVQAHVEIYVAVPLEPKVEEDPLGF